MRKLQKTLQSFKDRGVCLRVDAGNKLFLTRADNLNREEISLLKTKKPLLLLFVPAGKYYQISQILTAITKVLDHASLLVIDGGFDQHGAELRALPVGYEYLKPLNSIDWVCHAAPKGERLIVKVYVEMVDVHP